MRDYQITLEQLAALRSQLPHGANKRIATKMNTTEAYISMVLHGKVYNLDVLHEAIKLRDKEMRRLTKIKNAI